MIIEYSDSFLKEAKQLSKKFKLLKNDLKQAVEEIETNNDLGIYKEYDIKAKVSLPDGTVVEVELTKKS